MFKNRQDAGIKLALKLEGYRGSHTVIIAIPRGGVVVGYQIAKSLQLPIDIIIPRKIGAPNEPEYAIGAIAGDDSVLLDDNAVKRLNVSNIYLQEEINRQKAEIKRRESIYRMNYKSISFSGKTVILVDDGIATGYTMIAAARHIRKQHPKELIIAVPVAPVDTYSILSHEADKILSINTPVPFYAVGYWYEDFNQTTDDEVIDLLKKSKETNNI